MSSARGYWFGQIATLAEPWHSGSGGDDDDDDDDDEVSLEG